MESRAERSLDEADSRGSNVETGDRPAGAVMCETRDLGINMAILAYADLGR